MALGPGYASTGTGSVHIEGLAELQRQLRLIDHALGSDTAGVGELKGAMKSAADIVAREAKARAPYLSGDLFHSINPHATKRGGYVWGGGRASTPHFIVQEFGGTIPRYHSKSRTHVKPRRRRGYFFWPALENRQHQVVQTVSRAIDLILAKYFH